MQYMYMWERSWEARENVKFSEYTEWLSILFEFLTVDQINCSVTLNYCVTLNYYLPSASVKLNILADSMISQCKHICNFLEYF